jgi:cysteinyl-tRNA synthetase
MTSRYRHKLEYTEASLAGAAAGLASLRAGLAALGPAPTSGPWRAPDALRAGTAPARPLGTADGIAGNGNGGAGPLSDRAHAPSGTLSTIGRELHGRLVAALDDDLDLPTALAVVRETLRADLDADERRWLILDADYVLGLDLDRAAAPETSLPREVSALVDARALARRGRDFATSDDLRARLAGLGFEVTDGPEGQTVRRRD